LEFNSTISKADLIGLLKQGKLKSCADPIALDLQIRQLRKLSSRANASDPISRYLSIYDSVMRLAEIQVLLNGYLFDNAPHVAMRQVVAMICPEFNELSLKSFSDIRHLAKKNRIAPQTECIQDLESIYEMLVLRTVANGSLD
jgi:hypothetical protein